MAENTGHIVELFSAYGPVSVRRMFGGAGVFADGLMIALVVDGMIYLKADEGSIPDFEREGMGAFSYRTKAGTRTLASYWRMPERLYDEMEELAEWARKAMQAAQRSEMRGGRRQPGRKRRR